MGTRAYGSLALVVVSFTVLVNAQSAAPDQSLMTAEPFPLGVADPKAGRAFVHIPGGDVRELDLRAGVFLHSWPLNATHIGLHDGHVVLLESDTQSNRLQVDLLRPGDEQVSKIAVPLPGGINARDPRFSYRGEISGDALRLHWTVQGSYRGGAAVRPDVARSYAISKAGDVVIDLRTRQLSEANPPVSGALAFLAEGQPFAYQRHWPVWTSDPWHFKSVIACLTAQTKGQDKAVILNTESAGHSAKFTLITAHDPFAFVAVDGSAVLALGLPADQPQRGSLYSVDTGRKIGKPNFTPGMREFAVIGSRVYWLFGATRGAVDQLTLSADEAASGRNVWHLELGTTESLVHQYRRP